MHQSSPDSTKRRPSCWIAPRRRCSRRRRSTKPSLARLWWAWCGVNRPAPTRAARRSRRARFKTNRAPDRPLRPCRAHTLRADAPPSSAAELKRWAARKGLAIDEPYQAGDEGGDGGEVRAGVAAQGNEGDVLAARAFDGPAGDDATRADSRDGFSATSPRLWKNPDSLVTSPMEIKADLSDRARSNDHNLVRG